MTREEFRSKWWGRFVGLGSFREFSADVDAMFEPDPVLEHPLPDNDSGRPTVRGYLCELLSVLWERGESFSGKRPLGNSGWKRDLIDPLVESGLAAGERDAEALVAAAISRL